MSRQTQPDDQRLITQPASAYYKTLSQLRQSLVNDSAVTTSQPREKTYSQADSAMENSLSLSRVDETLSRLRQSFVRPPRTSSEVTSANGGPIAIMGVPFDHIDTAQTLGRIEEMIASGRPHYLVTANVDFLVQAHEDAELRRILVEADLVLCDGTPLVWVSRLLGSALPERVAGADLAPLLIGLAAEKGYRLFLLGATEESCSQAAANLQRDYPKLVVAGHYSPPFRKLLEMDHDEITRRIRRAKPDLLLVSFGCPKQEKWIAMHYRSLGVPVCVGVGATIDFLAGKIKRAPLWMRRGGIEWIFRLLQEPRRLFRRYARDLWVFAWCILRQWWTMQFRIPPNCSDEADWSASSRVHGEGSDFLLDVSDIKFLDSISLGRLIRLRTRLRASDASLVLLAPSPAIRRALSLNRLTAFFDCAPDLASAQQLLRTRTNEPPVTVRTKNSGPLTRSISWHGEVTAANAETVWESTRGSLLHARPERIAIDLSAVRFIDSSGLGIMVRATKFARAHGITLRFINAPEIVCNVIHLAQLESLLLESPTGFGVPPSGGSAPKVRAVPGRNRLKAGLQT